MKDLFVYILLLVTFSSCLNNDFLEKYPLGDPTAETAFQTYENFKAYSWGLYETFSIPGYGAENSTDDISYNQTRGTSESEWIRGIVTIPDSKTNTDWGYYSYIRRVNLMLDHIDASQMSDTEKANWRSVGYFFRSLRYFLLMVGFLG